MSGGAAAACTIRPAGARDAPAAFHVCLKTGEAGEDAAAHYPEDPDALGRLFVGPYLAIEPELSLVLEDAAGVCGYALAALDSRTFYARYDAEYRPRLCERFPRPQGDPAGWTPAQHLYYRYHVPDYFCPEPYEEYPSHLHIDLLPRVQGRGHGRRMMERLMEMLRGGGSPGVHLGVSARNARARGFYGRQGFRELATGGSGRDGVVYMGIRLAPTR